MATVEQAEMEISIRTDGSETEELFDILTKHLPDFLELFIRKNNEYGENAQTLGPRGQFSDMYRKMIKLKTAMWDGDEHLLTSEGVDEILMDLIGHCFLTLRMRAAESLKNAESGVRIESEFTHDALVFLKMMSDRSGSLRVSMQDLTDGIESYRDGGVSISENRGIVGQSDISR